MTAPVTSVHLRLPKGWIEFDPRSPDLGSEIMRAAHDEWGANPPAEVRSQLEALVGPLIVEIRRLTASADVLLVGLFVRAVAVEGAELPLILTANATLALSPNYVGVDLVEEAKPQGWTAEPIDRPTGRGVVMTGDTEVRIDGWPTPVNAPVRRYFLPVPGIPRVATLSFLTPNLELAEAF